MDNSITGMYPIERAKSQLGCMRQVPDAKYFSTQASHMFERRKSEVGLASAKA